MSVTSVTDQLVERLGHARVLDPIARRLGRQIERVPIATRRALEGRWMGVPLHPVLTDVVIGAWTSAWVLDLVGGRSGRRAAQLLVGIGTVTALPTIAAGFADWSRLDRDAQRVGLTHATINAAATVVYARSWAARRRGRHGVGVGWGMTGAVIATVGGHLGGVLVFRFGARATRAARPLDEPIPTELALKST